MGGVELELLSRRRCGRALRCLTRGRPAGRVRSMVLCSTLSSYLKIIKVEIRWLAHAIDGMEMRSALHNNQARPTLIVGPQASTSIEPQRTASYCTPCGRRKNLRKVSKWLVKLPSDNPAAAGSEQIWAGGWPRRDISCVPR